MRIRKLNGFVSWFVLSWLAFAQTTVDTIHADRVVVLKKERILQLLNAGKVIKTYKVALGGDPVGPKARQGDHKTPEGV
jgi:murein L,D-transpeptidase YafK